MFFICDAKNKIETAFLNYEIMWHIKQCELQYFYHYGFCNNILHNLWLKSLSFEKDSVTESFVLENVCSE